MDPLFLPQEGCTTTALVAFTRGTLSGTLNNGENTKQFCCPSSRNLYRPGRALLKQRFVLMAFPNSSSHRQLTPFLMRTPQMEPLAEPHRAGVMETLLISMVGDTSGM